MNAAPDFPATSDWAGLKADFADSSLLSVDCLLMDALLKCRGRLVYLATPYSRISLNLDGEWCPVRSDAAAFLAAKWAAHCAVNGITAISPIVHAVQMVNADIAGAIDPLADAFWSKWCQPLLENSDAVFVPAMEGWDKSIGVWREVCWAVERNAPVFLIKKDSEYGGGIWTS
ncbi:DUF1937 family protein [Pseudohalocynthiibacter aestuariivivens]|uniref:DUF1937 family protein n=1 Tax=Pseudohalocynthiibacter aestuariivivens TaxID=1591409 RepID=A0ABV5JGJ3_9RHOB|nr:DUF1937 family protein [Pseudohalocynthiibacter aestuariivivens]MBS9718972.1 DUF1937 family protein [Pseudohalocynthiibacter aestuariivivens]